MEPYNDDVQQLLVESLASFVPSVDDGEVRLLVSTEGEQREATDEELVALGVNRLYLDSHPEGADRGGYVPFVEFKKQHETDGGGTDHYRSFHYCGDSWC